MANKNLKIIAFFLASIMAVNLSYGQLTIAKGSELNTQEDSVNMAVNLSYDQLTGPKGSELNTQGDSVKMAMIVDSLSGTWELISTVRYENGVKNKQPPSLQLWKTPGAKPFTTLILDSLRSFDISQYCMKCPILHWQGHYKIERRELNGAFFFYIQFLDDRKNKKRDLYPSEFNAYLKHYENTRMILTDKEGLDWIYELQLR